MTDQPKSTGVDIPVLARSYNILDSCTHLRQVLKAAAGRNDLDHLSKYELHNLVNELVISNHNGEITLKAKLVEMFIQEDVIAAFETRVNRSRADFVTINGESKSFEIKSELDNLNKLSKQIKDYEKVFDYNYIVIDEKHYLNAKTLVPERYGIMVLRDKSIIEDRPGSKNHFYDSETQLSLFNKREFLQAFRMKGITREEVLINLSMDEINASFKLMLKDRYFQRWSFLVNHYCDIHAIDYQFFFQHNIAPNIIYRSH